MDNVWLVRPSNRIFLVSVLILFGGFLVWWRSTEPHVSVPFSVLSNHVTIKTKPSLAVGHHFAALVAGDGTLWAWGDKRSLMDFGFGAGQFPKKLGQNEDWNQVTAGMFGLLALKQNGSLWAMGANVEGLLGLTNVTRVDALTQVGSSTNWKELSAGAGHCLALKTDGSLWAWGKNDDGQVGVGHVSPKEPIRQVGFDTNWVAISAGSMASFAMRDDGTIWGWGYEVDKGSDAVWPIQLSKETNWASISAGAYHLLALNKDGFSYITGPNAPNLVDDPSSKTNWVKLSTGGPMAENYSGGDCVYGKRIGTGGWSRAGQQLYPPNMEKAWSFPVDFDPLLLYCQRGTTLMLMKDGRLWSYERRIGAEPNVAPLIKMRRMFESFFKKLTQPLPDVIDAEPVLIWEQE